MFSFVQGDRTFRQSCPGEQQLQPPRPLILVCRNTLSSPSNINILLSLPLSFVLLIVMHVNDLRIH